MAHTGETKRAMRSIHALAMAVDAKDPYTRNHSERVAVYATAIAVRLGLSVEQVERIAIAGTLHDVGKIAVPDAVLLKPATLAEAELEMVKRHSEQGERIVLSLGIDTVALSIRHHHEHWDGEGYPDGLTGDQIPLPSRILGAADALDAMTTSRAYRQALSLEQATHELYEQAEKQFDPQVAEFLVELLSEGILSVSEERRVVISYTLTDTATGGQLGFEDYQRIRGALFPGGERRQSAVPRISVSSAL